MPVCLQQWGKRVLTSFHEASPIILFFLISFALVYRLFGLQYSILVSVVTVFFQVRYKKSTITIYQYLWLAVFGSFLYTLAVLSSRSLILCVLLNLSVPFLLVFTLSSQFNPKGYFSYAMFFEFLALMPPETETEFFTELFVFWFCMLLLIAAIWFCMHFFNHKAALSLTLKNTLLELADIIPMLSGSGEKEQVRERYERLLHDSYQLPHHQSFFSVRTRKNQIYDMIATLIQRFSYLFHDEEWQDEMPASYRWELQKLSFYLRETAGRLDSSFLDQQIDRAHVLLNQMEIPEGRVRIFCRSLLHILIVMLEVYQAPAHVSKRFRRLNWTKLFQQLRMRFSLDSFEMRFALRLSIVMTITCTISYLLPVTRSYWIPLNAFLLLQPSCEDSSYRLKTRPIGTLLGCCVELLVLPFLSSDEAQILFALVMVSLMYCSTPGTWYQPIFSTSYALSLATMTLNETTAIQFRILYLCAAVLIVFVVNRFFFPIRREKLFLYNMKSLLQLHNSYWEIIRKELLVPTGASVSCDILTCFHMTYEECVAFVRRLPEGFRKERLSRVLLSLWHMFSELEQIYFLVQTEAVSMEEKPAVLRLISAARGDLYPEMDEQGLAFLESEISFKNMETTYVFRKYFKHARVLLKYSSDIFGEKGQRGTSWYPESKAAGQISGGRLTGHGN